MIKIILKTSFLFVLLISLSLQSSVTLEIKNEDQIQNIMNDQEISRSLKRSSDYGKIPLYFIPNEGQVDKNALFYAKASGYTLWLTKEGLVFDNIKKVKKDSGKSHFTYPKDRNNPEDFSYKRDVIELIFLKSNEDPEIVPVGQTGYEVNCFIGNDRSKWKTNIQTSRAVLYKELYRNIDLKICGFEKQIEYDFIVKPRAKVSKIQFEFQNVEGTKIDEEGDLVIKTMFGDLLHAKPVCYQVIEEKKIEVEANFYKIRENVYGFKVEEFDRHYELIIDPLILVYSTYLGGSDEDYGLSIAVDFEGAAYITGQTESIDFPTLIPFYDNYAGNRDVFITKISPSGDSLIYSTYLGGWSRDYGSSIAVDSEGAAYVTGIAQSYDFPTKNPLFENFKGASDAFIVKINASGNSIIYSTFLGGSYFDEGEGIAINSDGSVYVTGTTGSTDFPVLNPIQPIKANVSDIFITKINKTGSAIVYSTYLGGWDYDYAEGLAVDSEGAVYVVGSTKSNDFPTENPIFGSINGKADAFITKINKTGSAIVYSTYLGGYKGEGACDVAVDSEGAVYVVGVTDSNDFPTENPIFGNFGGFSDAFITKINTEGNSIVYSTFLGGSSWENGLGIAVDSQGAAYITGRTYSYNFPTKAPILGGNPSWLYPPWSAFITKIDASGSYLIYSTYLGGGWADEGVDIAVDSEGAAYVIGRTKSIDFPIKNPYQESMSGGMDVFISKLSFQYTLDPYISSLSPNSGPVGTEVTIYGSYFGLVQGSVTFNGVFASIISWSDTQIITTVPFGATSGPVIVQTSDGRTSSGVNFTVIIQPPKPDLYISEILFEGALSPYSPKEICARAIIKNKANAGEAEDIIIKYYINGIFEGENHLRSILPGMEDYGLKILEFDSNVENATLNVTVECRNQEDADSSDNSKERTFSFCFIDFFHNRDAFSFPNWGFKNWKDFSESFLYFLEVQLRRLNIGIKFFNFIIESEIFYLAGSGGHCWGMSAASSSYYLWSWVKPVDKPTFNMEEFEAKPDIIERHWGQVLEVYQFLKNFENENKPYDANLEYNKIEQSIITRGEPIILGLYRGEERAHAVVGYKILDLGADEKRVYVYDSNNPLSQKNEDQYIEFEPLSNQVSYKNLYNKAFAFQPWESLIDKDINSYILFVLGSAINSLWENDLMLFRTRSPVSTLLTDELGRKIGFISGSFVNEIPGAHMEQQLDSELFYLPSSLNYTTEITGTDSGILGLNLLVPYSDSGEKLVIFENIPISLGSLVNASIVADDISYKAILDNEEEIDPIIAGKIDADDVDKPTSVTTLIRNVEFYYILEWIKNAEIRDGLLDKLNAAQDSLNRSQKDVAKRQLLAFINQLESDKNVDPRGKNYLISYTKHLIKNL